MFLGSFEVKTSQFPALDEQDHLYTMQELGGAILPNQIDLAAMLEKKTRMGTSAPKVRLVVGKNYGKNSDGSFKPLRALVEVKVKIL